MLKPPWQYNSAATKCKCTLDKRTDDIISIDFYSLPPY